MRREAFLLVCVVVVGCGHGAGSPPARSSPALQLVGVASIDTSDPRTGMLVVGNVEQTVVRADATSLTTLSPVLPEPGSWTPRILRWFDGGAWVADFTHLLHLEGGAWRSWEATDCMPGSTGTLVLLDARGATDAWATLTLSADAVERLCRFDGTTWTPEVVPFSVEAMVALDDTLVALTSESPHRVMRRAIAGTTWTEVTVDFDGYSLAPGGDAAVLDSGTLPPSRGRITATTLDPIAEDVIVGLGTDRWTYEGIDGDGEQCGVGIGGPPCYAVHDWAQFVVYDGEGAARTETAHLDVYARDFGGDFADLSARFVPVGSRRVGAIVGDHLWVMTP